MGKRPIQYTVRRVTPELDRRLREMAASRGQSLNQTMIDELAVASGPGKKVADFRDVAGQLEPDPLLDEILESQRKIDQDIWA